MVEGIHVMFGHMKKSLPIIVILISTFSFFGCSRQESQLKDADVFALQSLCNSNETYDYTCDDFLLTGLKMVDDNSPRKDCLRYLNGYIASMSRSEGIVPSGEAIREFRGTCIDPNGKDYFEDSK